MSFKHPFPCSEPKAQQSGPDRNRSKGNTRKSTTQSEEARTASGKMKRSFQKCTTRQNGDGNNNLSSVRMSISQNDTYMNVTILSPRSQKKKKFRGRGATRPVVEASSSSGDDSEDVEVPGVRESTRTASQYATAEEEPQAVDHGAIAMQSRRTAHQRQNQPSTSGGTARSLHGTLNALELSNPRAEGKVRMPRGSHVVVQTVVNKDSPAEVNVNDTTPSEAPVQPSFFLRTADVVDTDKVRGVEEMCMPEFAEGYAPDLEPLEPHVSGGVARVESDSRSRHKRATTSPMQCASIKTPPPLPPKSSSLLSGLKITKNASRSTLQSASQGVALQTEVGAVGGSGLQNPNVCTPTKSHEDMRRDLNDMLKRLPASDQAEFLEGKRKVC